MRKMRQDVRARSRRPADAEFALAWPANQESDGDWNFIGIQPREQTG
jgi:hypothetical protein